MGTVQAAVCGLKTTQFAFGKRDRALLFDANGVSWVAPEEMLTHFDWRGHGDRTPVHGARDLTTDSGDADSVRLRRQRWCAREAGRRRDTVYDAEMLRQGTSLELFTTLGARNGLPFALPVGQTLIERTLAVRSRRDLSTDVPRHEVHDLGLGGVGFEPHTFEDLNQKGQGSLVFVICLSFF